MYCDTSIGSPWLGMLHTCQFTMCMWVNTHMQNITKIKRVIVKQLKPNQQKVEHQLRLS